MKIDHRFKAICFDMDGTLLETVIDYEKLGTAVSDTLVAIGVPVTRINAHDTEADMIRRGSEYLHSIGKEMSFDDISDLVNERCKDIEMEHALESMPFPGTVELLEKIKGEGYKTGLLTRGQRAYAETAMSHCGILGYMDAVEAFDDHPTGEQKPNPIAMEYLAEGLGIEPNEILYVGDSVWDYFCARDAGSSFIGICAGEYGQRKWEKYAGEVELVDSVADLLRMF